MVCLDRKSRGESATRGVADGMETGRRFQGYTRDGNMRRYNHFTTHICRTNLNMVTRSNGLCLMVIGWAGLTHRID